MTVYGCMAAQIVLLSPAMVQENLPSAGERNLPSKQTFQNGVAAIMQPWFRFGNGNVLRAQSCKEAWMQVDALNLLRTVFKVAISN